MAAGWDDGRDRRERLLWNIDADHRHRDHRFTAERLRGGVMNTDKATVAIINVSMDLGRVPGLLAFAVWLRVKDEWVLEMARSYVSRLERPKFAPDWIRCLANASHVDAIDDAADELADTPEFAFMRRVK